jgi:HlyD family secretion protein
MRLNWVSRTGKFFRGWLSAGVIATLSAALFSGCNPSAPDRLQGYIEGEFVYVSAPRAGRLAALHVQRGAQVKSNDLLFVLEAVPEKTAVDEAARRLHQARATLADLKKGQRPSEIAAISAQLKQSQAALQLSEREWARQETLWQTGVTTEQEIDQARSIRDRARERVAELEAELQTAQLGARPDQVAAAEANVKALQAVLARAEWDLAQQRQSAVGDAMVFDTLYRKGEWVSSGRPVVMLLPPDNLKLRVFVSEARLGAIQPGDPVQVFVDGAGGAVTGRVSFISPKAEFTPPVIYSRENRRKFVFLVEAGFQPAVAARLHPGQPVEVEFNAPRQP